MFGLASAAVHITRAHKKFAAGAFGERIREGQAKYAAEINAGIGALSTLVIASNLSATPIVALGAAAAGVAVSGAVFQAVRKGQDVAFPDIMIDKDGNTFRYDDWGFKDVPDRRSVDLDVEIENEKTHEAAEQKFKDHQLQSLLRARANRPTPTIITDVREPETQALRPATPMVRGVSAPETDLTAPEM